MKLSEKILRLRKQRGMSQEELAEKLGVSRQAVSRWEQGAVLPDASNILQLSRLFGVSADFLLNDEYEAPVLQNTGSKTDKKKNRILAWAAAILGLLGNFIIYVASRFVEVMVPMVSHENGETWYTYSSGVTDHNYMLFVQEYDLELLVAGLWALVLMGVLYLLAGKGIIKKILAKRKKSV